MSDFVPFLLAARLSLLLKQGHFGYCDGVDLQVSLVHHHTYPLTSVDNLAHTKKMDDGFASTLREVMTDVEFTQTDELIKMELLSKPIYLCSDHIPKYDAFMKEESYN